MMIGRFALGNTPGERTMRMTSRPSSTGMSQSMIMTSGLTVRMASSAATPSAELVGRLDAEIGQHHSRQPARIGIAVRDQDNKPFHGFLELLGNH